MIALYHGANSVCSIKVRIVLAEKGLEWESRHIDLPNGGQFAPEFLKVNPAAIVPVLDHDGRRVFESSVICEYLDGFEGPRLMPTDPYLAAKTRTWGTLQLSYHDAVNTLTFASYQRAMLLKKSPEELEARWDAMPDQIKAKKMRDLIANGPASDYVPVAFGRLTRMMEMMEEDLTGPWLMGAEYGVADATQSAYMFRLSCMGLEPMWEGPFPRVTDWFARCMARPSMAQANDGWIDAAMVEKIRAAGAEAFGDRFA
ncbi:MAG: glutathione S-transferase family protein [Pseudomonadota bacterium]